MFTNMMAPHGTLSIIFSQQFRKLIITHLLSPCMKELLFSVLLSRTTIVKIKLGLYTFIFSRLHLSHPPPRAFLSLQGNRAVNRQGGRHPSQQVSHLYNQVDNPLRNLHSNPPANPHINPLVSLLVIHLTNHLRNPLESPAL